MDASYLTPEPGHDLTLTDGTTTLRLMLADQRGKRNPTGYNLGSQPNSTMVVSQGQGSEYDTLEQPFSSIVQSDFTGGRGAKWFSNDRSRYGDSLHADTWRSGIRCGPKATQSSSFLSSAQLVTGTTATSSYHAYSRFTCGATITVKAIKIRLKVDLNNSNPLLPTNSVANIVCSLSTHDAGNNKPDTLITSVTIQKTASDADYVEYMFTFDVPATLNNGTIYWLGIYVSTYDDATSPFVYWYYGTSSGNRIIRYTPGGTVVELFNNALIEATLYTAEYDGGMRFVDYKGIKLCVASPATGGAPALWANGYFGYASSNSANKTLLNSGLTLTENELVGKIARIVSGPGAEEPQPWRKITANTTGGVITCAPGWRTVHAATTMFVILGCETWQEISAHGIPGTVTGKPLVVGDVIYFPQGESKCIRRGQYTSGGWAWAWDGTSETDGNMYSFLALVQDESGVQRVWGAKASAATVSEASKQPWGTKLAFDSTALQCGSSNNRITNLIAGKITGPMLPIVFKETEFGAINGTGATKIYDVYRWFPEVADENNGTAATQHDVYIWFSVLESIERYYDQKLDDIGPNRDEGMPANRRGRVADIVEYTNSVFIAVQSDETGYSSVLRYNGQGYHEIYRAPAVNVTITTISVQVVPGLAFSDRLWIQVGGTMVWIPIAWNPSQQVGYTYETGSQLTTCRHTANVRDVIKYWPRVKLFTEGVSYYEGAGTRIYVEGRVDGGAWFEIGYAGADNAELDILNAGAYVTGYYMELRFTLITTSTLFSPVIESYRLDAVVRGKLKDVVSFTALLTDGWTLDNAGAEVTLSADDTWDQLRSWMDSRTRAGPLTLSLPIHHIIYDLKGVINSGQLVPLKNAVDPASGRELLAIATIQFLQT